jgi:hypothetical protein
MSYLGKSPNATSGFSGYTGTSGYSGFSGSGVSGYSGFSGTSGYSGFSGISGTNAPLIQTFTYNNNFSAGNVIYRTPDSNYALAQANALSSTDSIGVIQSATPTQFTVVYNGYITGLSGIVPAGDYFLSDATPGLMTLTVPTAPGSVVKPIMIGIDSTTGLVVEYPGFIIGNTNNGTTGYIGKWTSPQTIGNSIAQDNGTTFSINGGLSALSLTAINNVQVGGTVTANAIFDSIGNVRNRPFNSQTSSYVLAATDANKVVSITTGGVTVNNSVFATGDNITILNNSGSNQTITQGVGVLIYLSGSGTTGNRTLAAYGVCTLYCLTAGTFVITGQGLT